MAQSNNQIFLILGLALSLVACGQGFESLDAGSRGLGLAADIGTCGVGNQGSGFQKSAAPSAPVSPFSHQKVQLSGSFANSNFSKASNGKAAIDVLVNGACVLQSDKPVSFLGVDLREKNSLGLMGPFSVPLTFESSPAIGDIEEAANRESCVIGVTEPSTVRASSFTTARTNDPDFDFQDHLGFHNFESAFNFFFQGNQIRQTTVVAVVDTGIDFTHPDLRCNMWPGRGRDIVNDDNDPSDDDPSGHGTHVAGIVGACGNNGLGITGVMPQDIALMAVKALDSSGEGSLSDVINGITYAVDNGAEVINLSLEADQTSAALLTVIQDAIKSGVVVVGAAGNSNLRINALDPDAIAFPAVNAGLAGLISVGSVDVSSGRRSQFSNYGREYVEIAAAGAIDSRAGDDGGVYSTQPGGSYARIMGTSQAAPIVSAAAALLVGYFKTQGELFSPGDIEFYLREKSSRNSSILTNDFAFGAILDLDEMTRNIARDASRGSGNRYFECL